MGKTSGTGAAANDAFAAGLDFEVEEEVVDTRPQDPNRNKKAVLVIDQVEGKPNYETVGVNGKTYQIQRGVEVTVPWEVVHVLDNAIETRLIQTTHPITGMIETTYQDRHAIPYRVMRWI